jgi:alkylresorcinol/alkylpyrone synthase
MTAYLHGLATALPPYELPQTLARDTAREILGDRYPAFERLAPTFESAGIDKRFSVVPLDWFPTPHGWEERHKAYLHGAREMFRDAATKALAEASWQAHDIDTIITVSSTGIATPTLEAQVHTEVGFAETVNRVPVFGLGCAGGVTGLALAADLARARPGSKILLVVVEACSVSFRSDRLQKSDIIATVLFGDGAAAACISTDGSNVSLGKGVQKLWPDTLQIMGWDVDDTGLGVVFDRSIPDFVSTEFKSAVDLALAMSGLKWAEIDRLVCHPGGAKVIAAIEDTLDLPEGRLDAERETLRNCGNMSAPTALFVLDRVLQTGAKGQMMTCALGPGFTASFLPLIVTKA